MMNQISSDTTTSIAPSQTSFTNITPTYSSVIPSIEYYQAVTMSDVSYWLSTVTSYNMAELTTSNVAIDLTWSISGSTAITYSLVAYSTYTLPTWITLDTANSQLVMITPDVTATTNYGLIVRSTISSTNYDKIVLISVVNTATTTTTTTSTTTATTPASTTPTTTSSSASSASSSSSDHLPLTRSQARATTSSVIAVSILMGTIVSMVSVYSPQKMWAILNQFQLYLLIGVLVPSLPQNLLELILSMQDSLLSFNMLSKPSINGNGFRLNMSNCNASGDYFDGIGIPSSCTLVDNLQLFLIYFAFLGFHLLVLLLLSLSAKCKWLRSKLLMKLFRMMTFSVYLRLALQSFMVLLLTSFSELKRADFNKLDLLASFVVSVAVVLIWLLLMLASWIYIRVMSKPDYNIETSFFREFHDGLKSTALGKWYMTMFLLRRFVWVSWVVFAADLNAYARIGTYAVLQTAILVYTWISRPFTDFWDNVIEILNDLTYATLWGVLVAFNNKDAWNSSLSNAIIIFLCSNAMLVFGIQFVLMVISLYRFVIEWTTKRKRSIQVTSVDATMIGHNVSRTYINSKTINIRHHEKIDHKSNSRNTNSNETHTRSKKFISNEVNMRDEEDN